MGLSKTFDALFKRQCFRAIRVKRFNTIWDQGLVNAKHWPQLPDLDRDNCLRRILSFKLWAGIGESQCTCSPLTLFDFATEACLFLPLLPEQLSWVLSHKEGNVPSHQCFSFHSISAGGLGDLNFKLPASCHWLFRKMCKISYVWSLSFVWEQLNSLVVAIPCFLLNVNF